MTRAPVACLLLLSLAAGRCVRADELLPAPRENGRDAEKQDSKQQEAKPPVAKQPEPAAPPPNLYPALAFPPPAPPVLDPRTGAWEQVQARPVKRHWVVALPAGTALEPGAELPTAAETGGPPGARTSAPEQPALPHPVGLGGRLRRWSAALFAPVLGAQSSAAGEGVQANP